MAFESSTLSKYARTIQLREKGRAQYGSWLIGDWNPDLSPIQVWDYNDYTILSLLCVILPFNSVPGNNVKARRRLAQKGLAQESSSPQVKLAVSRE